MGRFQLELIYLYFPPSSILASILAGTTVQNKGKLILRELFLKNKRSYRKNG
jgi:hypothetical protein